MSKKLEDFLAGKRRDCLMFEVNLTKPQSDGRLTMHRTKERPAQSDGSLYRYRLSDTPLASFVVDKVEAQADGTVVSTTRDLPVKLNDEVVGSARAVTSELGLFTINDKFGVIDKLINPETPSLSVRAFGSEIHGKLTSQEVHRGHDSTMVVNHFENGGVAWDYIGGPGIAAVRKATEVPPAPEPAAMSTESPEFWGYRILGGNKHRSFNPEMARSLWAKPDGGTFFMLVETMLDDDNVIWGKFDTVELKMHVRRLVSQMKQVPGMFPRTVLTAINQIKAALTQSHEKGRLRASGEESHEPVGIGYLEDFITNCQSEFELYDMVNRIFTDAAKHVARMPPRYVNMTLENLVAQMTVLGFEPISMEKGYLRHEK